MPTVGRVRELAAKPRVFYGWWIVGACIACLALAGGIGVYGFGVFMSSLEAEFGWSRSWLSFTISVYWLSSAVAGPFIGRLTDRYGPRRVMLLGAAVSGASVLGLSFINSLWQLFTLYAIISAAHGAMVVITYPWLVAHWFAKRRGTAMGITITGIGWGGLLIVPLIGYLITALDWRLTYVVLAAMNWAIALPLVALVIRARPQEMGLQPDGEPRQSAPAPPDTTALASPAWTVGTAMRTPAFWWVGITFFLSSQITFGVIAHEAPYIQDQGLSLTAAATALGFTAGMGALGKVLFGYLADYWPLKRIIIISLAVIAAGIVALLYATNMAMVWLFVIVWGLGMGGMISLRPLVVTWLYGLASFGAIYGAMQSVYAVGAAVGPVLAGTFYDVVGSYYWAFIIFIGASVTGMLTIILAPPPPPPPNPPTGTPQHAA